MPFTEQDKITLSNKECGAYSCIICWRSDSGAPRGPLPPRNWQTSAQFAGARALGLPSSEAEPWPDSLVLALISRGANFLGLRSAFYTRLSIGRRF